MAYHVLLCHTMLYNVILCYTMLCQYYMLYNVIPCYTMSFMLYIVIQCNTMSFMVYNIMLQLSEMKIQNIVLLVLFKEENIDSHNYIPPFQSSFLLVECPSN